MVLASTDIISRLLAHRAISLVGGGGKTTLMFRLARELTAIGKRVISTTTTKIFYPRTHQTGAVLLTQSAGDNLLAQLDQTLDDHAHVTLAEELLSPEGKLQGIDNNLIGRILDARLTDFLIVEADGAARRSFKAPAAHEPVVPYQTDLLIAVVGLDVVGKPLDPAWVHRTREVGRLTGLAPGEIIKPVDVATVIAHGQGLMKGLPQGAVSYAFLNKADQPDAIPQGQAIADILACRVQRHPQQLIIGAAARKKWIHAIYALSARSIADEIRDSE